MRPLRELGPEVCRQLTGVVFDSNTAAGSGGAVFAGDTSVVIDGCSFTANTGNSSPRVMSSNGPSSAVMRAMRTRVAESGVTGVTLMGRTRAAV